MTLYYYLCTTRVSFISLSVSLIFASYIIITHIHTRKRENTCSATRPRNICKYVRLRKDTLNVCCFGRRRGGIRKEIIRRQRQRRQKWTNSLMNIHSSQFSERNTKTSIREKNSVYTYIYRGHSHLNAN